MIFYYSVIYVHIFTAPISYCYITFDEINNISYVSCEFRKTYTSTAENSSDIVALIKYQVHRNPFYDLETKEAIVGLLYS